MFPQSTRKRLTDVCYVYCQNMELINKALVNDVNWLNKSLIDGMGVYYDRVQRSINGNYSSPWVMQLARVVFFI